jgi:hypothetical protein
MTSKVFLALRVPADPLRTFEVFTQEIALWWQPSGLFRVSDAGDGRLAFDVAAGSGLVAGVVVRAEGAAYSRYAGNFGSALKSSGSCWIRKHGATPTGAATG